MKISAIVPVKTFSKSKTRLEVPSESKEKLLRLMLDSVLRTLSTSNHIDKILIVSKDEDALEISRKYNSIQILDQRESGVNGAVALADEYSKVNGFEASIVFPQDIPFILNQDIEFLLRFQTPPKYCLVVPSRKFDGTNALVRMPVSLMETHYDEDSYKIHLHKGKEQTQNTSLVFAKRIMMDIDTLDDLQFSLQQNQNPALCKQIKNLF